MGVKELANIIDGNAKNVIDFIIANCTDDDLETMLREGAGYTTERIDDCDDLEEAAREEFSNITADDIQVKSGIMIYEVDGEERRFTAERDIRTWLNDQALRDRRAYDGTIITRHRLGYNYEVNPDQENQYWSRTIKVDDNGTVTLVK
jgi:hypothetical protein